jgi:zinc finger protein
MEKERIEAKRAEEEERAAQRAKLFLPVGHQVTDVDLREDEDDGAKVVDIIESLCMNCHEQGTTRLLLTRIPYFREVILMSFYCDHCHFKNTEIQSAGEIQPLGAKYVLRMDDPADMERQIVKSDSAIFRVVDLELEIPPGRGRLTNVEGILSEVLNDLELDQPRRKREETELYEKIDGIVQRLIKMINGGAFPYSISIDDCAGNSWIEPSPLDRDGKYQRIDYRRTPEQNESLGLGSGEEGAELAENQHFLSNEVAETGDELDTSMDGVDILSGKMYSLPCECPGCSKPATVNMQMVNVPYFKQVIITAVSCSACGYRTNEVKTGGEIPDKGQKIWLKVEGPADLGRDILKSETCCLKIPECSVEVQPGTMGGRFTTVEGLLTQIRDDLRGSIFDIGGDKSGDSMPNNQKQSWETFFSKLDQAIKAEIKYTMLLEDPLSNSYVQSFTAPEPDPQITTEEYERTTEEEEDLGLSDMRTHLNAQGEYVKEPETAENIKSVTEQ